MKKTLILAGFLALAPFAKGQLLLEALEGEIPFTPSEKCLERVKDKYYGDGDHNFIYCAVMGPGNKKWLNLNLGAEYAREGSEYFNPEAVPTDNNDWKAFGSLYNFNRDSDGHELVEYRRGKVEWEVKHKNGYTGTRPTRGVKSNVVAEVASTDYYWLNYNDPCPLGYHVADSSVFMSEMTGYTAEGGFAETSILKHRDYRNWNLVTAPYWYAGNRAPITDGFKITGTRLKDDSSLMLGSSSVWLRNIQATRYYVNSVWNVYTETEPEGEQPRFDRGYFGRQANGAWGLKGDYFFVYDDAVTSAVKCVEN